MRSTLGLSCAWLTVLSRPGAGGCGGGSAEGEVRVRGAAIHYGVLMHALRRDALRNLLRDRAIHLAQGRLAFAAFESLKQEIRKVAVFELAAFERFLIDFASGHHDASCPVGHVRKHGA